MYRVSAQGVDERMINIHSSSSSSSSSSSQACSLYFVPGRAFIGDVLLEMVLNQNNGN